MTRKIENQVKEGKKVVSHGTCITTNEMQELIDQIMSGRHPAEVIYDAFLFGAAVGARNQKKKDKGVVA